MSETNDRNRINKVRKRGGINFDKKNHIGKISYWLLFNKNNPFFNNDFQLIGFFVSRE